MPQNNSFFTALLKTKAKNRNMQLRAIILFLCIAVLIVFSGFSSGESQLSKLMLEMKSDMLRIKENVKAGKPVGKYNKKKYAKIYTAKVSSESKKGEHFEEHATAFLVQCERTSQASGDQVKIEYNNLVTACIRCHEAYCPGPLSMLKKMKVN